MSLSAISDRSLGHVIKTDVVYTKPYNYVFIIMLVMLCQNVYVCFICGFYCVNSQILTFK